jgi:polyisoprenoid-binding protein YceI
MTTATRTSLSALTGTYALDPTHTRIGFVARHAMVTKVRGSFNEFEGTAVLDGDDVSRSSATVTISAASIDTRQPQRDAHLRSSDFFSMDEHPTITFTSTAARRTGEAEFELDGELTIKGISRPVTIPFTYEGTAKDPFGNTRIGFEGSVVVNRKDWGMTYNAALETGGMLIGDKVTLEFEVSAVRTS